MTAGELKAKVEEAVQDASFSGGILALFNRCLGQIAAKAAEERKVLTGLDVSATVAATTSAYSVALPANYARGLYWVGSAAQKKRVGSQDYHNFTSFLKRWPDPALAEVGPVRDVAVKGSSLYYQPRAADTLTLHYFKAPTSLKALTAANIAFTSSTKTVSGTGLPVFTVGGTATVAGSASNDGDYTVVTSSGTSLVVAETLVDEIAGASVTISNSPDCIPSHLHEDLLVNFACREIYNLIEDGTDSPKTNTKLHNGLYLSALADLFGELEDSREEAVYVGDEYES